MGVVTMGRDGGERDTAWQVVRGVGRRLARGIGFGLGRRRCERASVRLMPMV